MKSIFLETNHLFLRNPRGGVEDVAAMKRAGFGAIFCNIGDHTPGEWGLIRNRAEDLGVVCGPWLRTAEGDNKWSLQKLDYLINIADTWQSPLIVNVESEIKGSDGGYTELISHRLGDRDAAISMEAWPFSNVYWVPLARFPILPQIFPVESVPARDPEACRAEWYKYGVNCVVFTFGAYGIQRPSQYNRLTPYGVYTADDCAGYFVAWSAAGEHNPCKSEPKPPEPEDDMQLIGDQHGISAMAGIFRQQWPDKTGIGDPNNLSTWKPIDKWERSMMMLVQDHDEMVRERQKNQGSSGGA